MFSKLYFNIARETTEKKVSKIILSNWYMSLFVPPLILLCYLCSCLCKRDDAEFVRRVSRNVYCNTWLNENRTRIYLLSFCRDFFLLNCLTIQDVILMQSNWAKLRSVKIANSFLCFIRFCTIILTQSVTVISVSQTVWLKPHLFPFACTDWIK